MPKKNKEERPLIKDELEIEYDTYFTPIDSAEKSHKSLTTESRPQLQTWVTYGAFEKPIL